MTETLHEVMLFVTGTQHEVMLFLLLSCNIKESELPRLAIHVASVQILLLKMRKLKYR